MVLPAQEHWIDRNDATIREYVWRDTNGDDYIDEHAESPDDEKVGHRDILVVTGTVRGSYPELGDLAPDEDGEILTLVNRAFLRPIEYPSE